MYYLKMEIILQYPIDLHKKIILTANKDFLNTQIDSIELICN